MDGLTDYQRRRLDLADMLRSAMHVARGYGDEAREQEARALLARLAAGRFRLAVAGQFSRGKTTLMNAVLGGAYLPTGALPMTSVVTTVRYGSRPRALIRRRGSSLPVEVPVAEVARFVTQASAERVELQVAAAEVEIPAEVLRLGFEFVDTPGVGSAIAANTATTLRFLPEADAIVFVTAFDSPLNETEADFLATIGSNAARLFLVINKLDLVSEGDAAAVTGFVRQWARGHLRASEPHVFAISALDALEAVVQADSGRRAGSGIAAFQTALTQFLTTEQGRVSLRNVAAGAVGLVGRQLRDLRAGRLADDGGPHPDAVTAAFDARIGELRAQEEQVAARIAERVTAALPGLLAERRPAWQSGLRDLLAAPADRALTGETVATSARDLMQAARDTLEQDGRKITSSWLERRAAEVHEAIISEAGGDIGALLDLARSPRVLGAEIAGLATAGGGGRDGPAGWSAEEVPGLAAPLVEWSVPLQRAGRRSRRGRGTAADETRRVLAGALDAAVASFTERAAAAFQDAAGHWVGQLRERTERQTSEEAAWFHRYLRTPPREEDLVILGDLGRRLAGYLAELNAWASTPVSGSKPEERAESAAGAATGHGGQCVVCGQIETALTAHLRQRQFLLATSEHDQSRHAKAGGFCPLHTWQYAHMASPVGIAAGYAKLADAVADALDSIGLRSGTSRELAQGVAGVADTGACPACAVLADRERLAVARLATQALPAVGTATLCLRHLALVLDACPSLGTGRALAATLTAALRRAARDMRAYALKREALRSGLVTGEEASAHSDTLRLLAGQPALVQSWGTAAHSDR